MKGIEGFYQIDKIERLTDTEYNAFIALNKDHEIYQAHFPGNPITPGACMLQIIREVTSKVMDKPLSFTSASNIKFKKLIDPNKTNKIRLHLSIIEEESLITVNNTIFMEEQNALQSRLRYNRN